MPSMRRSRRVIRALSYAALLLALCRVDAGEAPYAPAATPPYLTVFLLDGLSRDVFLRELAAGRLPHIARMVREGVWVENGIASFPSMTGYGFYPFITGRDAAKSGVLGLRFFARQRERGNLRSYVGSTNGLMNNDFSSAPPTLYERFASEHSFSINTYANRGVKKDVKIGWSFTMAKYRGKWWVPDLLAKIPLLGERLVPSWEQAESEVLDRAIEDLDHRPKIQWITFASIDGYQHVYGTDEKYAELVRNADALIGRYREESRRRGLEDERVYAVITDHGVVDARQNGDLRKVLGRGGFVAERDEATHLFESQLEEPIDTWEKADAVVVINGNMLNYLYFRDPDATGARAWQEHVPIEALAARRPLDGQEAQDVVALLLNDPSVELVIGRSRQGAAVIRSARGKGVIVGSAHGLSYRVQGDDPLCYTTGEASRLADGEPHSPNAWLSATLPTRFPDAIYRVFELVSAPDVGDLVVTAAPGWDFGDDYELFVHDYRGGHGGLRDDQMRVPYVLSGPGLRQGVRLRTARAEDIGRTLFELLSAPADGADGQLLDGALLR